MYRNDLEAALQRIAALERSLAEQRKQNAPLVDHIDQLQRQLYNEQQELARLRTQAGQQPQPAPHLLPRGNANTVLVLGVCSLLLCSLLGPVAWSMGNDELRKIDQGLINPASHSAATAGKICGMIATILMALGVFALIFIFFLFATI